MKPKRRGIKMRKYIVVSLFILTVATTLNISPLSFHNVRDIVVQPTHPTGA